MSMQLVISFIFLLIRVTAHSWVECVDYNGPTDVYDPTLCNGFPRPLSDGRTVGTSFGLDIGMDHRPANSGNQCQGNVAAGLSSYPHGVINYEAGRTYTLAWPPKNHVAANCGSANQYIPDNGLDLFVAPYNGVSDPETFTQAVPASFSDDRHQPDSIDFKGFQNCPLFCGNPDKALCTGTFTVPESLAPGTYTFQWHWAFNSPTDVYSTCWEANVIGGTGSTSIYTTGSTGISTTSTTLPQSTIGSWNSGLKLTHFWDCNGMGCDATTLQPWNEDNYVAAPGYSPQDPNDFGGSVYGEKMWVVGAASDTLAQMLGQDDGCCGSDTDSMGCGKCALIRVPTATNSDWTALIMKKNRCPPHSNGCELGNVHFDVAVPGYDNLQFSTANVCGQRAGTGFHSAQDSAVLGDWYTQYPNTAQASSRCARLPTEFQKGCELFSEWGWTRGDPNAQFQVVECPSAFKDYVADQFDANGVVTGTTPTSLSTTTTTTTPLSTTLTTTSSSNGDGACFILQCGCPDSFKESWCNEQSHQLTDTFCGANQQNCETCAGIFCPFDGPGGPTSTSTTTTTTTTTSSSCGYIPDTCVKPLNRMFNKISTKNLGKFEKITGVSESEASFEDIQLYFHCRGRNAAKCTGLEKPCTCSRPPCICPGEEAPTSTASTTSTTASTTSTTASTTTTTASTTSTTSTSTTTTTQGKSRRCALAQCGCNLSGQSWCNAENGWLSTDWCHLNAGNCQACTGAWCDPNTPAVRRLLKQN